MRKKLIISYLISIIIIAGLLFFVDLEKVWKQVAGFGLPVFAGLVLINFLNYIARGVKWKQICSPIKEISFRNSTYILFTGFLANHILPARIGEFVRAYILSKKEHIGKVASFSTVVVDRIAEGIGLIILLIAGTLLIPEMPNSLRELTVIPIIIFVFGLALFLFPKKATKILNKIFGRIPKINRLFEKYSEEFIKGGKAFRQGFKKNAVIWGMVAVLWILHVFIFYAVAVQLGIALSIGLIMLLVVFNGLLIMIPSAPGNIGPYEASFFIVFLAFGLPTNQAISMAIINHLIQFATVFIGGLFALNRLGFSWKNISKIGEKNERN